MGEKCEVPESFWLRTNRGRGRRGMKRVIFCLEFRKKDGMGLVMQSMYQMLAVRFYISCNDLLKRICKSNHEKCVQKSSCKILLFPVMISSEEFISLSLRQGDVQKTEEREWNSPLQWRIGGKTISKRES